MSNVFPRAIAADKTPGDQDREKFYSGKKIPETFRLPLKVSFKTFFSLMIPTQVHLRRPCYDFSFLQRKEFKGFFQGDEYLPIYPFHCFPQSVGATGGVYKRQGRNRCKLMTCDYEAFLVHGKLPIANPCHVNLLKD